ncbi:MAG: anthranilate phosphoribosyltransferase [Pseudomonadota bacterium]|nr:anthranilate phosphoribosyltransferase [Pseudomonadota bacterium]
MSDNDTLKPFMTILASGKSLTKQEAGDAFKAILSGAATSGQIGAFLMALSQRGETHEELLAGAELMRELVVRVEAPENAIDTCGTGGDAGSAGGGTYNISTAVAFVLAGCGVPVAKHGNRSLSSKSGSSEVLEQMGVNLSLSPERISACIYEAGMGFMFAPAHHSAMKHVGPVRAELGIRTIFNLLGPMSNPAAAKYQLMGVFDYKWLTPLAETLKGLGSQKAWVVHGSDGLDEITTTGPTSVAALENGTVRRFEVSPEDAKLPIAKPEDLRGGSPEENAIAMKALLAGDKSSYRDIVVLNSAAGLIVAGQAENLDNGARMAEQAIDSGKANDALNKLVEISQQG